MLLRWWIDKQAAARIASLETDLADVRAALDGSRRAHAVQALEVKALATLAARNQMRLEAEAATWARRKAEAESGRAQ